MKIFPVFIPFGGCPQRCIYCQQNYITKSTVNKNENIQEYPDFDTIREGLAQFSSKYGYLENEIAFYGGSFTLLPHQIQEQLLNTVTPFLTKNSSIRISTRPDGITPDILDFCISKGIKTIELGIQSFSDKVLKETKRSYDSNKAIASSSLIKDKGIKLGIQLMPGLPGCNEDAIEQTVCKTIVLKPDYVRIYPTIVLKGTELEQMYLRGEYKPLTLDRAVDICADMIERFEKNDIKVIKTGLHSDLSATNEAVISGPYHPSFGELVAAELYFRSLKKALLFYIITEDSNLHPEHKRTFTLVVSDKAVSLFLGFKRLLLNRVKDMLKITNLPVVIDSSLRQREFRITEDKSTLIW